MDQVKLSRKEQNELKRQREHAARVAEQIERRERERSKIRAMSLDKVCEEARWIIQEATGLSVVIDSEERAGSVMLRLMAKKFEMGYTSVTKTDEGSYLVGGTMAGCFMSGSDNSLISALTPKFRALEEKANAEAPKIYKSEYLNLIHYLQDHNEIAEVVRKIDSIAPKHNFQKELEFEFGIDWATVKS